MSTKLGSIDIPDELKSGLRHYARLEGERSASKLVEDACNAYLKVLRSVLEKDSAIQTEVAKELSPKRDKQVTARAS
jgi:hypothetical protein